MLHQYMKEAKISGAVNIDLEGVVHFVDRVAAEFAVNAFRQAFVTLGFKKQVQLDENTVSDVLVVRNCRHGRCRYCYNVLTFILEIHHYTSLISKQQLATDTLLQQQHDEEKFKGGKKMNVS